MGKLPRNKNGPQPEFAARQTKYRTWEQFRRGVRGVRGDVTKGGRLVLGVMGDYANYQTALTRPGNQRLMEETGLTERGLQFVVSTLRKQNYLLLVEGGKSGAGRGHANLFRIRVEDVRFPVPKGNIKPEATAGIYPTGFPLANQLKPEVAPRKPEVNLLKPAVDCTPSLSTSIITSLNDTSPAANVAAGNGSPLSGPIALLLRFRQRFGYTLTEADGRLGWINYRYIQRTDRTPVKDQWQYVLKANENFDLQYPDHVRTSLLERESFAAHWHIPLLHCPLCSDAVIVGMDCDCGWNGFQPK